MEVIIDGSEREKRKHSVLLSRMRKQPKRLRFNIWEGNSLSLVKVGSLEDRRGGPARWAGERALPEPPLLRVTQIYNPCCL